ncbi:uncharacterized protein MYCFIDRAFT_41323 [Pseudocercospora fijiensis CIRAD86]|uniref:Major facilitator superfamily (MFS) profile domain-containing protein n=1 Tax=Pseudocercospora fijiensis (strain CIRAD86) TaxID=383855 RepID=M3A2T2_PSEFD|nr:uncharacterized protein MYCFIDRAFT_41323 [Pseudocercospora fijiensis CIRAD86]EME85479.1 hypothetical protein MYCFIDRAFT_41323 [Pseudocercospora fijiensis CIRAD86]
MTGDRKEKQAQAEAQLHDQTNLLPKKELILVFSIMASSLLVCFLDQNGIGVLLPSIAKDLNAESSISWAGTSALIANTVFQVLYGRLSDLFGRKRVILSALILLSLSDLACGLSVNSTMLYIFRGLAGVANGGIASLSMMIVSDVVTLQERGKYQGILGSMVGAGNAVGPIIASAFATNLTWRGLFYMLAPACLLAFAASWRWLPSNMPKLNLKETVAKIDFLGLFFGTAAVILLLIPISSGGRADTPWDSPLVIAMLTVGGVCLVLFLLIEWRFAKLPMMPLGMFRKVSVSAMLGQSFMLGLAYYSYLYFVPLYFQNVRGKSALTAACLQLPMVVTQSIFSVSAGLYISKVGRYGEVIWFGFGIWTLGSGLLMMADRNIHIGLVSFFLVLIGAGTGCTFQPTLVALQAHCPKAQRAVVTSNRNFLRSSGGAVGLAVSSAILANVLKGSLPSRLHSVASSTFAVPNLGNYSISDQEAIADAYAAASRAVFICCLPVAAIAFLLSALIRDKGLVRKEEKVGVDQDKSGVANSAQDIEQSKEQAE